MSSDGYKRNIYYPTIDVFICDMGECFSDLNLALMKLKEYLSPKSNNFLSSDLLAPLLHQYQQCLPPGNLQNEITTLKNYLIRNPITEDNNELHDLLECIEPVPEAFPPLRECLVIAMTFGTSTATVERSFSSLHRIKTYLRSTMSQERLDNLALLAFHFLIYDAVITYDLNMSFTI